MNIFFLHPDPGLAARSLCDKHVPKMALETAQMLCTAVNEHGGTSAYKSAYKNHPSTVWARRSQTTFLWLCEHGLAICSEYTKRFGKVHKCEAVIRECREQISLLPNEGAYPAPQCMPDQYRCDSLFDAYRAYYINEKAYFAKWEKGTPAPSWWPNV
ncbi:MAG: hypothetical protein Unbinned80contig1000_42 [Prokaryotic dsDNA virus sp.]|nr:MAG: hypothetical protein Unbinned80contig1000_42 [Prokaryotic dsDNA virus sp.]|tara:strand:+ start:6410 stop:6880 length:471 start_codon:yes stop_codon:yes gene_type:complete